jgi:hypothetical protein
MDGTSAPVFHSQSTDGEMREKDAGGCPRPVREDGPLLCSSNRLTAPVLGISVPSPLPFFVAAAQLLALHLFALPAVVPIAVDGTASVDVMVRIVPPVSRLA